MIPENLTCPAQVAAAVGESISSPQHTKVYLRQQVTAFQIQLIYRELSPRDSSPMLAPQGAFLGSFLSILPKTGVLPMGVWEGREWVKSASARWPSPNMLLKSTCRELLPLKTQSPGSPTQCHPRTLWIPHSWEGKFNTLAYCFQGRNQKWDLWQIW